MLRWFTALIMLAAAALPAPVAAHASAEVRRETTSCCGGACACGAGCTCVEEDRRADPARDDAPAPARERDERLLAAPCLQPAPCTELLAWRRCDADAPHATHAPAPSGRRLLERIVRWTT